MDELYIVLTGGLGNQLFQIQYATHVQRMTGCALFFDISLGKPRTTAGSPDSCVYGLPGKLTNFKHSWLASKTAGYLLRSSHSPRGLESKSSSIYFTRILASIMLSMHFKKIIKACSPKDLGYDPEFNHQSKRILAIGYFQTHIYGSNIEDRQTTECFPSIIENESVEEYRSQSVTQPPLVIHVRKGDYALDDSFGILGPDYYTKAIAELQELIDINNIWIFSDEPENALSMIPPQFHSISRVMPEIENSPALTLEVMRLGGNYIIANSTFSWWAAQSSRSESAHVVAPANWFKGMKSPNNLIPENWIKVDSCFL